MPAPFTYPYDPIGNDPNNLIAAELHAVAPPVDLERANFIVPLAAPFYQESLQVRTGPLPNSPLLTEGTHYILTHKFVEATHSIGKRIYGSIMFLDREYTGNVYVTYQTLGGAYTLNDVSIVTSLTRTLYNIRLVTWTQIVGLPAAFPPTEHGHDTADLTGATEIVAALQAMVSAIISGGGNVGGLMAALLQHLTANGAHTKAQIGLGNLENYLMANQEDVELLRTNRYMNPLMVRYAINRFNLVGNAVIDSTEVLKGILRLATPTEALDGINPNIAISPATLDYVIGELINSIQQAYEIKPGDCFFTTVANRNPATHLGYGTWQRVALDEFIKGYNPDNPSGLQPLLSGGADTIGITRAHLPAEGIELELPCRVGGGGDPGDPAALDRNDYTNDGRSFTTENLGDGEPLPINPRHVVLCIWVRLT